MNDRKLSRIGPWLASVVVLLSLARAAPGVAQQAGGDPAQTRAAEDLGYERAIEQAVDAYNRKDYVTARARFEEAHAVFPNARSLRGLGASALELGRYDEAVTELRAALAEERMPLRGPMREKTEALLQDALAKRASASSAPAPVDEARPPRAAMAASEPTAPRAQVDRAPSRWRRALTLTTAALGVAGLAAGAGFGVRSMHKGDRRDELCPDGRCTAGSPELAQGRAAASDAVRAGNLSTAFWAVGGVALASAAVLWWTTPRAKEPGPVALGLGLGSLQLAGTF